MGDIKLRKIYRIDDGILKGTEIEPYLSIVLVRYPHRKTSDCYIPPVKTEETEITTWHCCQEGCKEPDFEGDFGALLEHIILHKGRLLKPWSKKAQLQSPIPAVKITSNPWDDKSSGTELNEERRFVVSLYIDSLKLILKKQGLEIFGEDNIGLDSPQKGWLSDCSKCRLKRSLDEALNSGNGVYRP